MTASRSYLPSSSKKRKSSNDDAIARVRQLESRLTSALSENASLNPLADLLDIALNAEDYGTLVKAIYALYRVFVLIISGGLLLSQDKADQDHQTVKIWLSDRLNAYVELLCGLLKDEEATVRTSALQILLSLQKHLSASLTRYTLSETVSQPQFHISHFRKIVNALLKCPPSRRQSTTSKKARTVGSPAQDNVLEADVRHTFVESWLSVHDDIRWFFLREAGNIVANQSMSEDSCVPQNLLAILEGLTTFPTEPSELNAWWVEELGVRPPKHKVSGEEEENEDVEHAKVDAEDDWRTFFDQEPTASDATKSKIPTARVHTLTLHQSLHSLASHRAVFTRTWLALLPRLSAQSSESRTYSLRVLNILHRGVIPHLTRPVLVMDWVASCVDYGGTVGLLALNALFTLMKEYNLDYPSFYTRLYTFIDRDVLHLKHRARFFRLTELFLSSTHLPATLVAAFVKRLSRLSLNAPPAAIIMIIPFTYNLLKRHPASMSMIHRGDSADSNVFDMSEPNPTLSNALDSSLWELYTHKSHYHAAVSTLACIFEEAFTRPAYSMEDFLDHTYGTLFDTEAQRRIRKDPAVSLDSRPGAEGDIVSDLWDF
ncbi:uncharacterized protein FIBRA_00757 [Fibroporia radiculosa]|uniref:CCAAT-binding factor domain-containing protein n=1 Tax=Fibroporia radiculosa TaxID=599839 RepID=J4HS52_9APHY|nr:uncharacterized protein FIBRA_00757 [Fibroporia radiculosa]CCL98752.1 predicted protein [Fibroporia radiculosa]